MNDSLRPFCYALLLCCLIGIIATVLHGCGSERGNSQPSGPRVDIQCDETSCTILVHDADTIEVWRDGYFYWFEDVVPPGRRYTNRDEAPKYYLTVEACNELDCAYLTHEVL